MPHMDAHIHVKISADLKKRFRQAAEELNPWLPKSQLLSNVIRELITDYVKRWEEKEKNNS